MLTSSESAHSIDGMTGMLIRVHGARWQTPETTAFIDEHELKLLVKDIPALLSDSTAFVDEYYIPGVGQVDLLGVSTDGSLTLVECKLRKNPEIKREVVGQILAYAGGLWRTTYEDFASRYTSRAQMPLLDYLQAETGVAVEDHDGFRSVVHRALQSGSFRLVIAVDEITEELKLVVEFLNAHTSAGVEVVALEVDYAKDGDVEILVPRTYGESLAAAKQPGSAAPKLTTAEIMANVASQHDSTIRAAMERLLRHGGQHGHHFAPGSVGMSCWYAIEGAPTSTWAVWPSQAPEPVVSLSIGSLAHKAPRVRVLRFVEALKAQPELAPFLSQVNEDQLNKFPSIPFTGALAIPSAMDALLAAIDRLIADDV